ncbi:glycosyltransferase family 4 protein [Methanosarcina horonobensis]|uniref:glycosyltransferase family 4 protein n=1 Tax=Methanosarcina horonobensis TaxID=418008 RepID=UPI0022B863ED|nr:glycosyltransferase family 4 protein [Methanosarcina horonobensis]
MNDFFMKVLICASEYYPYGSGIANVAYNVVEQLKKMGIECSVCSPTGPDIKIPYLEGHGRLGLIHFWYKVSKYFKDKADDYDIIWLHYPLFIGKIPFKNSLVTVHSTAYGFMNENISPKFYYRLSYLLEKHCLNRFKGDVRFTGVSSKTCSELSKILPQDQYITRILNGVDTSIFKPAVSKDISRKKFNIPLDSKVILSVGRLVDHKMPFLMLGVFNELQKKGLLINTRS